MEGLRGPVSNLSSCHQEPSSYTPACHQVPLPEEIQVSPGDTEIHRVEPEDVANHLTAFHWELFRCVHEVGTEAGAVLGGWREKCAIGRRCSQHNILVQGSLAASPWATHGRNLSLFPHLKKIGERERDLRAEWLRAQVLLTQNLTQDLCF